MPDSHLDMAYEDRFHVDDDWDDIFTFSPDPGLEHDDCCGECEICGEPYCTQDARPSKSEIGEFVAPPSAATSGMCEHVIAHAECGLNAGYPLA